MVKNKGIEFKCLECKNKDQFDIESPSCGELTITCVRCGNNINSLDTTVQHIVEKEISYEDYRYAAIEKQAATVKEECKKLHDSLGGEVEGFNQKKPVLDWIKMLITEYQLLPCPWCGGTPIAEDKGDCFMFICPEGSVCRRTTMFVCIEGDRETAIKRWNTRAKQQC